MALTFPTPPTPPTPPKTPKVVLEGGGSVTEMPRPKSYGPKTDDAINEQKAKESVAKGGGALSKTTTKDDSKNTNVTGTSLGDTKGKNETAASQKNPKPQNQNENVAQNNTNTKYIDTKEFESNNKDTQTQTMTQSSAPFRVRETDTGHGALYWGFTIISILALLIFVAKKFLIKNTANKHIFSKRDLSFLTEETSNKPREKIYGEVLPSTTNNPPPPLNVVKNYETQNLINKPKKLKNTANKEIKTEEQTAEPKRFEVRI